MPTHAQVHPTGSRDKETAPKAPDAGQTPMPEGQHAAPAVLQQWQRMPQSISAAQVLHLQRSIGNRAVARLLGRESRGRSEALSAATGAISPVSLAPPGGLIQRVGGKAFGYELEKIKEEPKPEATATATSEPKPTVPSSVPDSTPKATEPKPTVPSSVPDSSPKTEEPKPEATPKPKTVKELQTEFEAVVAAAKLKEKTAKQAVEQKLTSTRYTPMTPPKAHVDVKMLKNTYTKDIGAIGLTPQKVVDHPDFKSKGFSYEEATGTVKHGTHVIAKLLTGDQAFALMDPQPTGLARQIYTKLGKSAGPNNQYVKDDRGAYTRRYAYVEKDQYQIRTLLQSGKWSGQYQQKQAFGGKAVNKYEMDPTLQGIYPNWSNKGKTTSLTKEEMALIHQEKGSGYQQRGVSLRSTPKEIYGNKGETFRSTKGVRVKVDLAKAPVSPSGDTLLNHYGSGGLKDVANTLGKFGSFRDNEHYKWSVQKNRELYLEELTPDMVEDVQYHATADDTGDVAMAGASGKEKLSALGTHTKFADFRAGYEARYTGKPLDLSSSAEMQAGWQSGKQFVDGWLQGKANRPGGRPVSSVDPSTIANLEQRNNWDYAVGYAYGLQNKGGHPYQSAASIS
jgi:hypothetical protein